MPVEAQLICGMRCFGFNRDYFKTVSAYLTMSHLVLGSIVMGILCHMGNKSPAFVLLSDLTVLLIVSCSFFITSFVIFFTSVFCHPEASPLEKTSFFAMYNVVAAILYLITGLNLAVERSFWRYTEAAQAAGVIGIINAVFYIVASVMGFKALCTA